MIKWFDSKLMPSMPTIENNQGDLLRALTLLLTVGINQKTVTSIAHSEGLVTLDVGVAHGFINSTVVLVENSTQTSINNKEFRVSKVGDTTISFEVSSPVNAEIGVTVKYAPLGFDSYFASEGKACFKSKNPQYPAYLRIDDTKVPSMLASHAKFARVEICENMTDFDTAEWQSPYDDLIPAKNRTDTTNSNGWFKWYYSAALNTSADDESPESNAHHYVLIGNGDYFWLIISPYGLTGVGSKVYATYGLGLAQYATEIKQVLVATDGSGKADAVKGAPSTSFINDSNKLNIAPWHEKISATAYSYINQSNGAINSNGYANVIPAAATVRTDTGFLVKMPAYISSDGLIKAVFKGVGLTNNNYGVFLTIDNKLKRSLDVGQPWVLVFDLE